MTQKQSWYYGNRCNCFPLMTHDVMSWCQNLPTCLSPRPQLHLNKQEGLNSPKNNQGKLSGMFTVWVSHLQRHCLFSHVVNHKVWELQCRLKHSPHTVNRVVQNEMVSALLIAHHLHIQSVQMQSLAVSPPTSHESMWPLCEGCLFSDTSVICII